MLPINALYKNTHFPNRYQASYNKYRCNKYSHPMENTKGKLKAIWIKRFKRGPMDPMEQAELIAGKGLRGNADQGRKRQVTIIEQEVWDELMRSFGAELSPSTRRANLMISGISLENSRKKHLQIGECLIRIYGETKPCERMDEALSGLKDAMYDHWKGGAFGEVITGGKIRVGDRVKWVEVS